MPRSSRLRSASSATLGMSRVISSGPSFVSRASDSYSIDVDRGVHVLFDDALRKEDRVLEVVALPGHERDQHVAAERHLTVFDGGPSARMSPLSTVLSRLDPDLVVEARALVGARELLQRIVPVGAAAVRLDHDLEDRGRVDCLQVLGVSDVDHRAGDVGDDHLARVLRGVVLDSRPDQRRVGDQQRHRLALHVGAHEGAALRRRARGTGSWPSPPRTICFGEMSMYWMFATSSILKSPLARDGTRAVHEPAFRGEGRVGLGDSEHVLLVGGQVLDTRRNPGATISTPAAWALISFWTSLESRTV